MAGRCCTTYSMWFYFYCYVALYGDVVAGRFRRKTDDTFYDRNFRISIAPVCIYRYIFILLLDELMAIFDRRKITYR